LGEKKGEEEKGGGLMGARIELPEDQWADLYDPIKVPERKRRPVVRALVAFMKDRQEHEPPPFDAADLSDDEKAARIAAQIDPSLLVAADDLNDALVVALVREWSFGAVTLEVLLDLPADTYRVLSEACSPHMNELMPNFQVSPDPKASTGSSS
jgi:hypothetical protein